jgi:putative hydrolase of the HAD superfamily
VRTLAAGHRVGLLTNGPSDIQRLKLQGTGLTPLFDDVVISGEIGVGKPQPAVFARVLGALGIGPEEAVMVGDSWERDIQGATSSGLSAVWVAFGRPVPEDLAAVTVIEEIGELAELLG